MKLLALCLVSERAVRVHCRQSKELERLGNDLKLGKVPFEIIELFGTLFRLKRCKPRLKESAFQ
jgi:hypothetical protein